MYVEAAPTALLLYVRFVAAALRTCELDQTLLTSAGIRMDAEYFGPDRSMQLLMRRINRNNVCASHL
jgi:hypothetical protein